MELTSIAVISAVVFAAVYALIIWDKFDRALVAGAGAVLMIVFGALSQEDAFAAIDWNTIGLLAGMMVIVLVAKRSGIFEYLAVATVKIAKARPVLILLLLSIITGLLSAVLDSVTTILLILPVTLSVTRDLKSNPIPFIISEIFVSNIGGTATMVGNPPNIILGSAAGLSFMDFLQNAASIALPLLLVVSVLLAFIYRKQMHADPQARAKVLAVDEKSCIKDKKLLIKSVVVLCAVIAGLALHSVIHLESATIALVGAVALLLLRGKQPQKILHEIEWKTILFFAGLFIMVGGLQATGVIGLLAQTTVNLTHGDPALTVMAILWVSALASAFIDNIPFVATMIPLVKSMGALTGMALGPVWWALALGACLGGNGTIIGASANVVAIGMAEEHGVKITFKKYFKVAFPLMLLTVGISTIYIWAVYLR
jgi:Na+/H+ antiporter NhaD/arsenite permease-like protein